MPVTTRSGQRPVLIEAPPARRRRLCARQLRANGDEQAQQCCICLTDLCYSSTETGIACMTWSQCPQCQLVIHTRCFDRSVRGTDDSFKCPSCRTEFDADADWYPEQIVDQLDEEQDALYCDDPPLGSSDKESEDDDSEDDDSGDEEKARGTKWFKNAKAVLAGAKGLTLFQSYT